MIITGLKDLPNGHHVIDKETEKDRKPVGETRLTSMQEKHGQDKLRTETFGAIWGRPLTCSGLSNG